jgi:hypothetical protein
MARRPRVGTERIALQTPTGSEVVLATRRFTQEWQAPSDVFTQRLFLVSPDGSALVYTADQRHLRLRGPGGERVIDRAADRDVRFSADGRWLATLRGTPPGFPRTPANQAVGQPIAGGTGADLTVAVFDVRGGEPRALGTVHHPSWMEWVKDGVVVSHHEPVSFQQILTYFPLEGGPRVLVSGRSLDARFTAAARGTRVLFFNVTEVFSVDVTGGEPVAAGKLPTPVWNVEMSPDGNEAAIVTHNALQRWRPDGIEPIESGRTIHTVWYSPGGKALAYAANDEAVVLAGGKRHALPAPASDLRALRFRHGGDGLIAVRGDAAILWRPATGDQHVLAQTDAEWTLQAADVYRGGTVLWTRRHDGAPPGARSKAASRAASPSQAALRR